MDRKLLIITVLTGMVILIISVSAQGIRPTFQGDPAACAWYTDTSIPNGLSDYHGLVDTRSHPDWRGTNVYDSLNIFARANDNSLLWYRFFPTPNQNPVVSTVMARGLIGDHFETLVAYVGSSLAAVQRGPNTIDVFYSSSSAGYIGHVTWDGRQWSFDPIDISDAGYDANEISVSSWGPDRMDLIYATGFGVESVIWHKSWDGRSWRNERGLDSLPVVFDQQLVAASWGPNNIEVVARGQDDAYYRNSYGLGGWSGWRRIPGGIFSSAPCITPTPPFVGGGGSTKINIFGRGTDMRLYAKGINSDGTETIWEGAYGGNLNSAPAAVNYVGDHFTVFARVQDNTLWMLDWDVGNFDDLRWQPLDFASATPAQVPRAVEVTPAQVPQTGTEDVASPSASAIDLTGTWQGDDGGSYYIRQIGEQVWWYGEEQSINPGWSNVASGELNGNNLELKWVDVPKGRASGQGTLSLIVENSGNRLTAQQNIGFGASTWNRISTGMPTSQEVPIGIPIPSGDPAYDLSGIWKEANGDVYYIRQIGSEIWWFGEQIPNWANVAVGNIGGNVINLRWIDVPKGQANGHGVLTLSVENSGNTLIAQQSTGGFGGLTWNRI